MSNTESETPQQNAMLSRLEELNAIGIALSNERDTNRLLEKIMVAAKRITNADAGTLYLLDTEQQALNFEIIRTDSLGIAMGGTTGVPITFYPVQLYDNADNANHNMVVAHAALSGKSVNIPDAYEAEGYDFSGTQSFDRKTGYRSTSLMAVPMRNHENELIGVLQLINAQDRVNQQIVPFSLQDQSLLESLASQAAIALTNHLLIQQMESLFESFISLINTAIDEKSNYTGGHCERVPVLTMMLADAVNRTSQGPLKDFTMTEKDRYELKIAGLLHDCGKITTPVHVVDKSTKLETIFDRIHLLDTRFEVLKRDAEIKLLRALQHAGTELLQPLQAEFEGFIRQLDDDRDFLRNCNIGSEKMDDAHQERVRRIAAYRWCNEAGEEVNFLSADELENLTIRAGTLTQAERQLSLIHI